MFRPLIAALFLSIAPIPAFAQPAAPTYARGVVFEDRNSNEKRDQGEPGLPDVRISNGREIVKTAADGSYEIPITDDCNIFVIKPRGWRTPLSADMLPRFYYTHKPAGSPPSKFPGVAPTGPLPASVDFPLYPQKEPDQFRAILWADPQPRNLQEIEYITHDVIEELIGVDASFGVTLGDIMFDNISLFEEQNARVALIGIPWYNVIGNHDINYDSPDDRHSDETFERVFGPNYYSFDHGTVHFIALDDVDWYYNDGEKKMRYRAGLGPDQIAWVKNDLALIPADQLVVLMMHIPLDEIRDRQDLFRLIEQRPFCMSVCGHTHYQEHRFIKKEDGWLGPEPHHHVVNVTVSGSWWSGVPDERGIPHTTMRDGAPNGYSIISFDGAKYSIEFKAAHYAADYQMNIMTPESVDSATTATTEVVVNVFGGSERSTVEMRIDDGAWAPLARTNRVDPWFSDMLAREAKWVESLNEHAAKRKIPPFGRKLPSDARKTPHIWVGMLPHGLPKGIRQIEVRTTDMFGKTYTANREIAIR